MLSLNSVYSFVTTNFLSHSLFLLFFSGSSARIGTADGVTVHGAKQSSIASFPSSTSAPEVHAEASNTMKVGVLFLEFVMLLFLFYVFFLQNVGFY